MLNRPLVTASPVKIFTPGITVSIRLRASEVRSLCDLVDTENAERFSAFRERGKTRDAFLTGYFRPELYVDNTLKSGFITVTNLLMRVPKSFEMYVFKN